jgi:uncharacterized membrane protein YjjP (DUF1212 family)
MIDTKQKKILLLAVRAGELLMKHGAETYRVEDTIERICKACGVPYVEVFATQTGIFVSIDQGTDESDVFTYVKRISGGNSTDLKKVSEINKFSREFVSTDMTIEEGSERLREIKHIKPLPIAVQLLGAALISAFFCLLFEGGIADSLWAAGIGIASYTLSLVLAKFSLNYFMKGFCCSALACVLSLLVCSPFEGLHYASMLIGVQMIFVPGGAITRCIRDFLAGHMVSGLAKMAEVFIIAISLATGAGIVLALWSSMGGVI